MIEVILLAIFWVAVVWRVTALLVYDSIAEPFRRFTGVKYNEFSDCKDKSGADHVLCCHKCTSIWVALTAVALFIQPTTMQYGILITLALSTGSIIVNKLVNGE